MEMSSKALLIVSPCKHISCFLNGQEVKRLLPQKHTTQIWLNWLTDERHTHKKAKFINFMIITNYCRYLTRAQPLAIFCFHYQDDAERSLTQVSPAYLQNHVFTIPITVELKVTADLSILYKMPKKENACFLLIFFLNHT